MVEVLAAGTGLVRRKTAFPGFPIAWRGKNVNCGPWDASTNSVGNFSVMPLKEESDTSVASFLPPTHCCLGCCSAGGGGPPE